ATRVGNTMIARRQLHLPTDDNYTSPLSMAFVSPIGPTFRGEGGLEGGAIVGRAGEEAHGGDGEARDGRARGDARGNGPEDGSAIRRGGAAGGGNEGDTDVADAAEPVRERVAGDRGAAEGSAGARGAGALRGSHRSSSRRIRSGPAPDVPAARPRVARTR